MTTTQQNPPEGAVAFTIEMADGTMGIIDWTSMDRLAWWQRNFTLREGERYVFAVPALSPPREGFISTSELCGTCRGTCRGTGRVSIGART